MPQGGIDKGENPLKAAYRELNEETSIKTVELIQEIKDEITYHLPDNLLGIIWKGKFKGQTQKWYIMRFLGEDNEINLKTKHLNSWNGNGLIMKILQIKWSNLNYMYMKKSKKN